MKHKLSSLSLKYVKAALDLEKSVQGETLECRLDQALAQLGDIKHLLKKLLIKRSSKP